MERFAERHREGLWTALGDPAVWRWVKIDASAGREVFDAWFDEAVAATAARTEFGFVTVAREDDRPVGSSRFLALRPADRGLEIGWSLVSPGAWGTGANTEAKLLMLTHAFEQLGCARVEFKTDARNDRARAALAALAVDLRRRLPQAHADVRRPLARLGLVLDHRRRVATGARAAFRAPGFAAHGGLTSRRPSGAC